MNDKQKRYALYGGAGLILLFLLYRWYSGNQASNTASTAAGTAAPDTSSSDYAALAGQEQGDVAGLQGGLNTLTGQEQSDITGLQSTLAGLGSQESSDITGLTGTVGGLTGQLQNLSDLQSSLGDQIASLASGEAALNRAQAAQNVTTQKGGAFYNYYVKVTGHPPPATVQTSNFLYQAWKGGVKATALQAGSGAHPSSKNTHIQHPNGNHTAKTGVAHPNTKTSKTAPPAKTAGTTNRTTAPKGKAPPAKTRTKASGKRK